MIIKPYLDIDSFTIAMLTDEQKTLMTSIAEAYNNMVTELHAKQLVDDKVSLRLPEQIMQLYIITL